MSRRLVNFAFVFGFIPELEIRYRQDKEDLLADKYAPLREYAASVSALRTKYVDRLALGTFRDENGLENPDRTMIAKVYESDAGTTVAVWNDSGAEKLPDITLKGKRIVAFETPDGIRTETPRTLKPDEIAIMTFE